MYLDHRHQEIIESVTEVNREIEVVEFSFNLTTLRVSKKIPIRVSDGSIRAEKLGTPEIRFVNRRRKERVKDEAGLLHADFGGISVRRLFQINCVSSFEWSMITTEKYAEGDFERFKRFINKRVRELKELRDGKSVPRRRKRTKAELPTWVIEAVSKFEVTLIDEAKNGKGVNPVHTACRGCIFAVVDGKTQMGCTFHNRLEKFRALGSVVEVYDAELEFSVVNGRYCTAYRNEEYLKNLTLQPGTLVSDVVRKEMSTRLDYVIVVNDSTIPEKLAESVASIYRQTLKPHLVVLASNQTKWRMHKLVSMMEKLAGENANWQVVNLVLRKDNGALLPDSRAVDEAVLKCQGHFYVRINSGVKLPWKFAEQIDKYVTDELGQFSVLEGTESLPAEVVQNAFHQFAKGNETIPVKTPDDGLIQISTLPEKAKFYEEAGDTLGMLKKVTDICK